MAETPQNDQPAVELPQVEPFDITTAAMITSFVAFACFGYDPATGESEHLVAFEIEADQIGAGKSKEIPPLTMSAKDTPGLMAKLVGTLIDIFGPGWAAKFTKALDGECQTVRAFALPAESLSQKHEHQPGGYL